MEIRLLKSAQTELDEAFQYYEKQVPGLGAEFLDHILAVFKRIKLNPEAWPVFSRRSRRCLANQFPFGVIYQIRRDEILIIAIAHQHRKPEYWKTRIE
ncbi:MAG: type II toxin-antitoxin system RelE/ParE family toxin [Balneolaceae bacterium]